MSRNRFSWEEFCEVVEQAVASLPAGFQPYLENVAVDVQERPGPSDWARLEDRDDLRRGRSLLLGLFTGVPLSEQGYGQHHPNRIVIFRRPLEQVSHDREELLRNIRETVLHELAHHFGFNEEEVERMEAQRAKRREGGEPPN